MSEVKLRFNLTSEEVELLVDDKVALTSGKDVFVSWVNAYNDKHKPVEVEKPVEEKVEVAPNGQATVTPEGEKVTEVLEVTEEVPAELDKPAEA